MLLFSFWGKRDCNLTAMREGGICIRSTIDTAARVRYSLRAASGHYTQDSGYNGQHKYEAGYSYGNGKSTLRHAQGVFQCLGRNLKNKNILLIYLCYTINKTNDQDFFLTF